jgi:hypothetical protein
MHTAKTALTLLVVALTTSLTAGIDTSKLPPAAAKTGVTYAADIKPILEASCFKCHTGEKPKAGLRLDSHDGVLKGGKEGKVLVVGNSAKSLIVEAVSRLDPETAMPPTPRKPRNRPGGTGNEAHGDGEHARPAGTNAPTWGGQRGPQGPPPKPLTAEQVGLVRAWIDQGAK